MEQKKDQVDEDGDPVLRMCIDTIKLNKNVVRERYQSSTPHEQVATVESSQAETFSTIEEFQLYHLCDLDDELKPLTTFIIPFGRFRYKRAPFEISSIS